jgi:hypothetical protein
MASLEHRFAAALATIADCDRQLERLAVALSVEFGPTSGASTRPMMGITDHEGVVEIRFVQTVLLPEPAEGAGNQIFFVGAIQFINGLFGASVDVSTEYSSPVAGLSAGEHSIIAKHRNDLDLDEALRCLASFVDDLSLVQIANLLRMSPQHDM